MQRLGQTAQQTDQEYSAEIGQVERSIKLHGVTMTTDATKPAVLLLATGGGSLH